MGDMDKKWLSRSFLACIAITIKLMKKTLDSTPSSGIFFETVYLKKKNDLEKKKKTVCKDLLEIM